MTTRNTQPKRLPLRRARLIAAAVSAAAVWVPHGSRAQELSTGFEIEERPIQKVPTTFKFQSRISQAKMPVGSQTFNTLYVNLVRGSNDVLCSEQLNQVPVRDSVLNIEIGKGFNCPLDDIIATNNDLNFQICIQSRENCLKPIALSSVPYAIKATFSQQAQESHTADIAAQCHYAHRVTADTGLLSVNSQSQYGYGYYDFATPIAPNALSSLAMPTGVTSASGFLQWTPVNPSAQSDLTVCSRTHNGTALTKLDVFNVQAANSYFSNAVYVGTESMQGYLAVDGNAHVVGDLDAQNGTLRTNLSVGQDATTGRDLTVGRNANIVFDQSARNGKYRANLEVDGAINIAGTAGTGDLTAAGNISARNGTFSQNLTAASGVVRGNSLVSNTSVTTVSVTATGHVAAASMGTTSMQATNATVTGRLLAGNGTTTGFEVTAAGQVIFYDAPQFPNGVVFPAASHTHSPSDIVGTLSADQIPSLDASKVTTGLMSLDRLPFFDASRINGGLLSADRIPGLDALKVTTGTFNANRIPGLDASKLATGTLDSARIPALDASKVTTGTLSAGLIPGLDASKTTSGVFDPARIPGLSAAQITSGTLSSDRLGSIPARKLQFAELVTFDRSSTEVTKEITSGACFLTSMETFATNSRCDNFCILGGCRMKALNAVCRFLCM